MSAMYTKLAAKHQHQTNNKKVTTAPQSKQQASQHQTVTQSKHKLINLIKINTTTQPTSTINRLTNINNKQSNTIESNHKSNNNIANINSNYPNNHTSKPRSIKYQAINQTTQISKTNNQPRKTP